MTEARAPTILSVPSRNFRVHEHLNSATFATHPDDDTVVLGEGQQPDLMWEITIPDLVELASTSTNNRAVVNAWRGSEKVGEIDFEFARNFDSFTMTFVAQSDFTSIHALSLSTPTTVVVIRSEDERRVLLINSQTHEVIGGDADPDDLDVLIFPAQQVLTGLQAIRDGIEALANGPQVVFSDASVRAEQRCRNNRKAGWIGTIAVTVGAALAVPTRASPAVAIAGFLAAGAAGGAAAAVIDNNYDQCMDDAKEAENKRIADEIRNSQDEEGGE